MPEVLYINHPLCAATILLQGAQLISWIPTGKSDIFWSSDISYHSSGKAFRGGIPICWPWFGKTHLPAHGFARIMPWKLTSQEDTPEYVMLEFALTDTPQTLEMWPHSFALTLHMKLGSTCSVTLHIDAPVLTTGALHTYLRTSDITDSSITGLGSRYLDALQENGVITTDLSTLKIDSEVDRIYTQSNGENTLITPDHTLNITHERYSDIVVWNPWIQRSEQIADMHEDDYLHMVCIETARITQYFEKHDFLRLTLLTCI